MAYNNSTNSTGIYWSCRDSSSEDMAVMMSIRIYFGATLAFVVVGLVGNVLSMLVFKSREMQGVSSNVYLLTLAASDSCYLISVFLSKTLTTMHCWYFTELALDIVNRGDTWCVLLQYLCDLFSNNSTCVILAFTVERAVAVFRPMRYKELCTVARARCVCARAASARALRLRAHLRRDCRQHRALSRTVHRYPRQVQRLHHPVGTRGRFLRLLRRRDVHISASSGRHHRRHQRFYHLPRDESGTRQASVDDRPRVSG